MTVNVIKITGKVKRVNGPVVEAAVSEDSKMLDLVEVGEHHLIGEIVKLKSGTAVIQVYEDTTSLKPGAPVFSAGLPLSVELGPGLLTMIYDGIQRPLELIKAEGGCYINRGIHLPALSRQKKWKFTPVVNQGEEVLPGKIVGNIKETELVEHRIMIPPNIRGKVDFIAAEGDYSIEDRIAVIDTPEGKSEVRLYQNWPVRWPRPYRVRRDMKFPLVTGQRVIDTLFPVTKGGVVAIPGGFGTGKTMLEHAIAKWCDADVIIFIGCGERGNEITSVLTEFPELTDPESGVSLMERTVIIANTSNMPVAAREASIYTGITIAEYYRDMGYHVALMADSTSRWAEALRELSGRMEEMPADEGFPTYLPARLASFYERAGYVETLSGREGSITIVGSVSPPGGDFSEPVTQHTKRFIRCFWALDRQLADARHYPAISWVESYSGYTDEVKEWWNERSGNEWMDLRSGIMELLQQEIKLQHVVKLVGPDVLPDTQRFVLLTCDLIKNSFLQQNSYDPIDMYCTAEKQILMLKIISEFYRRGREIIKMGAPVLALKRMKIFTDITKIKFTVRNEETGKLRELLVELNKSMDTLERRYAKFNIPGK